MDVFCYRGKKIKKNRIIKNVTNFWIKNGYMRQDKDGNLSMTRKGQVTYGTKNIFRKWNPDVENPMTLEEAIKWTKENPQKKK